MTDTRVEFGRPGASQMMPGGVGSASRSDAILGEALAKRSTESDPHGGATSPKGAAIDALGVISDYMDKVADIARVSDQMSIESQVRAQLRNGEDVVIDLREFNANTGYGSITGRHSDDDGLGPAFKPGDASLKVSRTDQRFAGVCPANPDKMPRTPHVDIRRPNGTTVRVSLDSTPAPRKSAQSSAKTSGDGGTKGGSRDRDRGRYDNNNFDRNRGKDLDGRWDGSFDVRRIA